MRLQYGNMWDTPADVYLFTGNCTVRSDGALVMGRGAALEAQHKFPGCNKVFGKLILEDMIWSNNCYGVLIHPTLVPILACFQVKLHYASKAIPDIISYSTGMLSVLAQTDWRDSCISMNFPGIGYGGLSKQTVLPLIKSLPDNVTIWEYR